MTRTEAVDYEVTNGCLASARPIGCAGEQPMPYDKHVAFMQHTHIGSE